MASIDAKALKFRRRLSMTILCLRPYRRLLHNFNVAQFFYINCSNKLLSTHAATGYIEQLVDYIDSVVGQLSVDC